MIIFNLFAIFYYCYISYQLCFVLSEENYGNIFLVKGCVGYIFFDMTLPKRTVMN